MAWLLYKCGNAARSILFDRQQAIEKSQAIEHANKIEDEITKNSSLILLKKFTPFHKTN